MIAICVGHSRLGDKGAVSVGGMSEWNFNLAVATEVSRLLNARDVDARVYSNYPRNGYTSAMSWLAYTLRKDGVTLAVELHFNSAESESAHGHEWLHWHTSPGGRRLAISLQHSMMRAFPQQRSRGIIPIRSEHERGGGFLRRTPCPAVICEPFFGSNPTEWALFSENRHALAATIADGIFAWSKEVAS